MKVLSLKQPWAELILSGKKKIELKKWNTHFRGEFLIHSSKFPDEKAMKRFGFRDLPCGFIVGRAKLINVKKYKDKKDFIGDFKLHLAAEELEQYGFVLGDVGRVENIPTKGKLNFWEFDLK